MSVPWEAVIAGAVALLVGMIGHRVVSNRNVIDAANSLTDQLQEELTQHRREQAARIEGLDTRVTQLSARADKLLDQNDRYRDLLHKHRAHIWDGKPPPPPEWPDDLPR